jgi:hypothetical protein
MRPTRSDAQGRAYLDLQNRARREGRPTQELLTMYALERFLARLAASDKARNFVLKGGMLMAAFGARRSTTDADLLATRLDRDQQGVLEVITAIAASEPPEDDGIEFAVGTAAIRTIREGETYAGSRVTMDARVATATLKLSLDVNFGDPVTPGPELIDYPVLRESLRPFRLLGYPLATVLAEKLVTGMALGRNNTRVRDFADLWTLIRRYDVPAAELEQALRSTAQHREVPLLPLSRVTAGVGEAKQELYERYRSTLGPDGAHLPSHLPDILEHITAFVDPLLAESHPDHVWSWTEQRWRP